MTERGADDKRLTKNERREAAREKARLLREEQAKRDKRNRLFIQGGIGLGVLVVLAIVALVIVNSVRPPQPGPLNMASDGIVLGEGLEVVPTVALKPGETPVATEQDLSGNVANIVMYIDYLCPYCEQFETTNAAQIGELVNRGAATVEVHPVPLLKRYANAYSMRAANAAACVANYSPNSFWDFHTLLFQNQPDETGPGLPDSDIKDFVKQAGAKNLDKINSCISNGTFKGWADDALLRFLNREIPYVQVEGQFGTPLVIVNGQRYLGSYSQPEEFRQFIDQATNSSSTPTTPEQQPNEGNTPQPSDTPKVTEPEGSDDK